MSDPLLDEDERLRLQTKCRDLDNDRGRLRDALRAVEWGGQYLDEDDLWKPACPECSAPQKDGHRMDCAVAAALSGEKSEAQAAPEMSTHIMTVEELAKDWPYPPEPSIEELVERLVPDKTNYKWLLRVTRDVAGWEMSLNFFGSFPSQFAGGPTIHAAFVALVEKVEKKP